MKQTTNKIFTLILLIVFFVGLSVLLYPALSQYWNSKVQSKAVTDYEKMIQSMSEEDYSVELEKAYKYNEKLNKTAFPLRDYKKLSKEYNSVCNVGGNGIMGYISIDKLQLEIPIYHGDSDAVLNTACGHFEGTSLPVGGKSTHCVLSGHRGLPSAKLFSNLDQMAEGDTFSVRTLDKVLTYEVDEISIVLPADTAKLQIVAGEDLCTLMTGTPYGVNTHRLLVRGHRVDEANAAVKVTADALQIDPLLVAPAIAVPLILILFIIVILHRNLSGGRKS